MWKKGFRIVPVVLIIIAAVLMCLESCTGKSDTVSYDAVSYYGIDYVAAVSNDDFNAAYEIVDYFYQEYRDCPSECDEDYWMAVKHVMKAEAQLIAPDNNTSNNQRLVYKLTEISPVGKKPKSGDRVHDTSPYKCYVNFVEQYNSLCDEILSVAITYLNRDLAEKIASLYAQDAEGYATTWDKESGDYDIEVIYTWSSRDEAQKRIRFAFE